jgi:hypothetical protein
MQQKSKIAYRQKPLLKAMTYWHYILVVDLWLLRIHLALSSILNSGVVQIVDDELTAILH